MQQSVRVNHSVAVVWCQYSPLVVQPHHSHAIVSLHRTEIVQCREHHHYRVLAVVQVHTPQSAQCSVKHLSAVNHGVGVHVYTIHHQLYQLGVNLKLIVLEQRSELAGVKLNHVVKSLHHYRTVGQFHCFSVYKHLVRNIVVLVVAVYTVHAPVGIKQHGRNTVACTHPDVMPVVFHYRVYYVVE